MNAVTGNQIGVAGAHALAKALELNRTLTELSLISALPAALVVVSVWLCLLVERVWLS
jgi:hypothetical protein